MRSSSALGEPTRFLSMARTLFGLTLQDEASEIGRAFVTRGHFGRDASTGSPAGSAVDRPIREAHCRHAVRRAAACDSWELRSMTALGGLTERQPAGQEARHLRPRRVDDGNIHRVRLDP